MVEPESCLHQGSVVMNVLDTLGLVSSSFGAWQGVEGGNSAELSDPGRFRYLSLQFKEDMLVGANCLGLTQHVGVLRGLIQSRLRLGKWRTRLEQDPTRIMEAYLGVTQGANWDVT
jgi:NAD(P)H-nitrite reductase large subunit